MTRDQAITRLKEVEPEIRARGVTALYLYGSHARGEAGAGSDIDVFVDVPPGEPLGFDAFMDVYAILKSRLGTDVDYTTRNGLVEFYRPAIEKEAIKVF